MKVIFDVEYRTLGELVAEYTHEQTTDASVWTVNHNLGRHPASVRKLTTAGHEFSAEVMYISNNQFQIILAAPARGTVIVLG